MDCEQHLSFMGTEIGEHWPTFEDLFFLDACTGYLATI